MNTNKRCATCGRPRGLAEVRHSWRLDTKVYVPRTENPDDKPWQICNDLLIYLGVHRNGGTSDECHLCDECLRVAIRKIKNDLSMLLDELDCGHDLQAELAEVNKRLADTQFQLHKKTHEHDRMQSRLNQILPFVPKAHHSTDIYQYAKFEAER